MSTRTLLIAATASAALMLAGCGTHHHATAHATSSAARADEKTAETYVRACIPSSGTAQVVLAKNLATSRTARRALVDCLGVPPANRTAAEGALLAAAEHVHWASSTSRRQFADVTVPAIAVKYRGQHG